MVVKAFCYLLSVNTMFLVFRLDSAYFAWAQLFLELEPYALLHMNSRRSIRKGGPYDLQYVDRSMEYGVAGSPIGGIVT